MRGYYVFTYVIASRIPQTKYEICLLGQTK